MGKKGIGDSLRRGILVDMIVVPNKPAIAYFQVFPLAMGLDLPGLRCTHRPAKGAIDLSRGGGISTLAGLLLNY